MYYSASLAERISRVAFYQEYGIGILAKAFGYLVIEEKRHNFYEFQRSFLLFQKFHVVWRVKREHVRTTVVVRTVYNVIHCRVIGFRGIESAYIYIIGAVIQSVVAFCAAQAYDTGTLSPPMFITGRVARRSGQT